MYVQNSLILVLFLSLKMFFSGIKEALALSFRAVTSASVLSLGDFNERQHVVDCDCT